MDLLKLLIADDEENIRNGLKCILDWESCGYKFCGEASNGKDAVSQIIDLQPDLVILDIKMPGLTGIEVISQVKSYFEKHNLVFPSFIILSGYSEFEYAQKTINLGAKAFLLKPVDEDELQQKVISIAQEIKQNKILAQAYKNSEVLKVKDFLMEFIQTKKINNFDFYKDYSFFENAETSNYQVAIFYTNYCKNFNSEVFENSINNYFSFFNFVSIRNENKIILFIKAKNVQAIKNCIERASKLNSERTFITLGKNYIGLEGIAESYSEAIDYEKYLFYFSSIPFVSYETISVFAKESNYNKSDLNSIISTFIFCIETYDKKQLYENIEQINKLIFCPQNKPEDIKKDLIYCLVELRKQITSKYQEREIVDGETYDVVPKILEMTSYEQVISYFKSILENYIENFNFNTADSVIVKVIAYVKNNYANDLKLESLGDMFNCNSAYLGKKFKKYTGVQFNTYLDNLRIEEAKKKIIETDLKIYQISKIVGYSNTDYFFMKFKKNTGLTPKEYKKQVDLESGKIDEEDM